MICAHWVGNYSVIKYFFLICAKISLVAENKVINKTDVDGDCFL